VIVNGLNPGESASVHLGWLYGGAGNNVTVTSLINTFSGSYTGDQPPPIPSTATYNGVTVRSETYPGTSPCAGGSGIGPGGPPPGGGP
jgi:hypothetical protein